MPWAKFSLAVLVVKVCPSQEKNNAINFFVSQGCWWTELEGKVFVNSHSHGANSHVLLLISMFENSDHSGHAKFVPWECSLWANIFVLEHKGVHLLLPYCSTTPLKTKHIFRPCQNSSRLSSSSLLTVLFWQTTTENVSQGFLKNDGGSDFCPFRIYTMFFSRGDPNELQPRETLDFRRFAHRHCEKVRSAKPSTQLHHWQQRKTSPLGQSSARSWAQVP